MHITFFLGGVPHRVFWVGAKKFILKKLMCFFCLQNLGKFYKLDTGNLFMLGRSVAYVVFGWNRNYEGKAVPIPAKHFINGVWLE